MSELETIAAAAAAGSSDPRPRQLNRQLVAAAEQCDQAAQSLQHAEGAAKQFVGRVVGGSGGGGGSRSPGADPYSDLGAADRQAIGSYTSENR